MPHQDLTGERFGKLTVVRRVEDHISSSGNRYPQYLCQCDCGNTFVAYAQALTGGHAWQCGCETNRYLPRKEDRHGDASPDAPGHRLYGLWSGIKRRCYNSNFPTYPEYGGKGIEMCDDWREDYKSFKDWAIENGYDIEAKRGECTIDRIDFEGNYSPENCRFVSISEQNDNKSNVIHIEYQGQMYNMKQLASVLGINYTTLMYRYHNGLRGDALFQREKHPTRRKTED